MNMASIGILFVFTVICLSAGSAKITFIDVQCKKETVGQYGQQSLLECVTHTGQDVSDPKIRVVTWKKGEEALLVFNQGKIWTKDKGYSLAEPSWNDKNMNVSLLITNTTVKDEGTYICMVITDSGDDSSQTSLKVTAPYSTPTINSSPVDITRITGGSLTCETDGGYPKGKIRWFGLQNEEWTESSTQIEKQTESGLFHLSSTLTLKSASTFSMYTCVVYNASRGKEDEVTIDIPEGNVKHTAEGNVSASKIVAPIVVIGSLIVGLLIVLLLYRRRTRQARRQSTTPLMGDHHGVPKSDPEESDFQEMDKTRQHNIV